MSPGIEQKINEVIALGRTWGMSESEIEDCLRAVASDESFGLHDCDEKDVAGRRQDAATEQTNVKKPCSEPMSSVLFNLFVWVCRAVKRIIGITLIIAAFISLLYVTVLFGCALSPQLENQLGKVTLPWIYPTMRLLRMTFKPVADTLDISGLYSADCLVENPFYLDPVEDCGPCVHKTKFLDFTGQSSKKMVQGVEELTPFIIKGFMQTKVDMSALQKMYFENERRFKLGGTRMFDSNLDVANITDFFYNYNHEDMLNARRGTGYVAWDTNNVPSSQAIRKLFPRPNFVLEQSEVSLLKRIYIEGPLAGRHELPIGGFANTWYVQAHGSRQMRLVPHVACTEDCETMSVVLNAGDLVFYQDQFWRLVSDPINEGIDKREISIGFSGSFML